MRYSTLAATSEPTFAAALLQLSKYERKYKLRSDESDLTNDASCSCNVAQHSHSLKSTIRRFSFFLSWGSYLAMRRTQGGMLVLYASIVLYSICFMMQQPLLPYLTKELGASTAQFATLQSIFSGAQTVGGLLSGE